MNMRSFVRFGISAAACLSAGLLGSLFVTPASLQWIDALNKPSFYPPAWVFAPVWLVLYLSMALSLTLMWNNDPSAKEVRGWVPLFFAHLLVNASWTIFFFGYHAVFIALIDIFVLWWCILLLFCGAMNIERRASWLLVPYFLWVTFALVLNASVWYLN